MMRFRQNVLDPATGELIQEIGFDTGFELLQIAEYLHMIEGAGGGMFYSLDENFKRNGSKWKGEAKAIEALVQDGELQERILTTLQLRT
jgi:hypothetical protein